MMAHHLIAQILIFTQFCLDCFPFSKLNQFIMDYKMKEIKYDVLKRIQLCDEAMSKLADPKHILQKAMQRLGYAKILELNFQDQIELNKCYSILSKSYYNIGCIKQAISHGTIALRREVDQLQKIEIELILGKSYLEIEKYQDARAILFKLQQTVSDCSQQLSKQRKFDLMIEIRKLITNTYVRQENYQQGLKNLQQINKLNFLEFGKTERFALNLVQIASVLYKQKSYYEAQKAQKQAIEILIDQSFDQIEIVSKLYMSLAKYQREIQKFEEEYSSLIKAKTIFNQIYSSKSKQIIEVKQLIEKNLQTRNKIHESLRQCLEILELQKQFYGQITVQVGKSHRRIADLDFKLNKLSSALKHYLIATNIFQQHGEKRLVAEIQEIVKNIRQKKSSGTKNYLKIKT